MVEDGIGGRDNSQWYRSPCPRAQTVKKKYMQKERLDNGPLSPSPHANSRIHLPISCFLFLIFYFLFSSLPAHADTITTRVSLTPGRLAPDLTMEGFERNVTPAQPALPLRELGVALHPLADLATVKVAVEAGPVDTLPGRHALRPNPPVRVLTDARKRPHEAWGRAGKRVKGRDLAAYGAGVFPRKVATRLRVTNRRGLLVLRLGHTPLRYRHSTGELLLHRAAAVTVSYTLKPGAFAHDPQIVPHLGSLANVRQARQWYGPSWQDRADMVKKIGYAIMVPDALAKKSSQLAKFILHKQKLGFSVTWVRNKDLQAITVGPKAGDAERMRFWLQKNYKKLNLKYLLIIGNPDPSSKGVPMKMTYAYANNLQYSTITPSDYYYADLTGNWDLDGDGKVAEYPDDDGDGGIDWTPEIYVGRIPIYDDNVKAMDRILAKTIAYASDRGDKSWRQRVLQPAAMLFYENQYGQKHYRIDGATMAKAIWDKCIKPKKFSHTTLFEEDGVDPSRLKGDVPLTRDNVIKEWRKGYGLVTWFGHGSPEGVFRTIWKTDKDKDKIPDYGEISSPAFLTYDDVKQLDDTRPAVVFHGSCSNGHPERPYNIGYGLLLNGAVATVSSTRIAVVMLGGGYATSKSNIFGAEMDFTDLALAGKPLGEALFAAKLKLTEQLGMLTWFTRVELTLYGDPALSMTACLANKDCDDGNKCNGAEVCSVGQCVAGAASTCTSTDPCTVASCDAKTGKCTKTRRPEGESCDDGKWCTSEEICVEGKCKGWGRCNIRDNPCVATTCDEKKKTCTVVTDKAAGEVCREGTDREGVCTAGLCEPQGGDGCNIAGGSRLGLAWLALLLMLGWAFRRKEDDR